MERSRAALPNSGLCEYFMGLAMGGMTRSCRGGRVVVECLHVY